MENFLAHLYFLKLLLSILIGWWMQIHRENFFCSAQKSFNNFPNECVNLCDEARQQAALHFQFPWKSSQHGADDWHTQITAAFKWNKIYGLDDDGMLRKIKSFPQGSVIKLKSSFLWFFMRKNAESLSASAAASSISLDLPKSPSFPATGGGS